MSFELIPAIDLLGGRVVRLSRGDYGAATVYDPDPGAVARRFDEAGAPRIHVVDLDAARSGERGNEASIRAVVAAAGAAPVQLGGGIRDLDGVKSAIALGVDRVVIGTAALRDPELVREAAKLNPGRIVVGIDARDGHVAVEGWLQTSETTALDMARRFEDAGVAAIVHTDIARDGMLTGPNLEAAAQLAELVSIPVIVSGGVASLDDVKRAAALAFRGVAGVIAGRALYTGDLDLDRALEAASCC